MQAEHALTRRTRLLAAGALLCLSLLFVLAFLRGSYALAAFALAAVILGGGLAAFEAGRTDVRTLTLIAVMTALSVAGRAAFAFAPGFKPVTAVVVITAVYLGAQAGFMTGAASALVSNMIFGQGPWTPFQMLAWGLVGLLAGILAGVLRKSRVLLCVYGAFAGIFYSLIMDFWTVLWFDGGFNLPLYGAALISALPFTAVYVVSNVVFLAALARPIGDKLKRIKTKYNI